MGALHGVMVSRDGKLRSSRLIGPDDLPDPTRDQRDPRWLVEARIASGDRLRSIDLALIEDARECAISLHTRAMVERVEILSLRTGELVEAYWRSEDGRRPIRWRASDWRKLW